MQRRINAPSEVQPPVGGLRGNHPCQTLPPRA